MTEINLYLRCDRMTGIGEVVRDSNGDSICKRTSLCLSILTGRANLNNRIYLMVESAAGDGILIGRYILYGAHIFTQVCDYISK